MVSHDSLVRAEKRLGVPAVIGRFHKAPRQLQDDYELDEKVGWNHGGLAEQHIFWGVCNLYASFYTHTPHGWDSFVSVGQGGYNSARLVFLDVLLCYLSRGGGFFVVQVESHYFPLEDFHPVLPGAGNRMQRPGDAGAPKPGVHFIQNVFQIFPKYN